MKRRLPLNWIALVIFLVSYLSILRADSFPVGTWVRRANKEGVVATMVIEAAGTGRKLTFKVLVAGGATVTMVVTTQGDGKDAPVFIDGKPSGETMAIRVVDDRHNTNIVKMNGATIATQKSEVSADGKVITTESTPMIPGAQNTVEYWDKK